MAQPSPAHEELAARTSTEHQSIVDALHTLERALVSPAPGREVAWKRCAGIGD